MKRHEKTSYPISAFRLWKYDGKKWYSYNYTFDMEDKNSLSFLRAIKLVATQGWQPYYLKQIPGKHPPIVFEEFDYGKLECFLKDSDPVGYAVGNSFKDFLYQLEKKKERRPIKKEKNKGGLPPESLEEIQDKALLLAVDRYKKGLPVPEFLAHKVEQFLCRSNE